MYIQGFLIPVPPAKKDEYIKAATWMGDILKEYGATEIVEGWEEDIEDGKNTDFRMAVKAQDGEKVVFSWVIWPDKQTCDTAKETMIKDERMQGDFDPPFDGKRMIWGGFSPVYTMGRAK